MKNNTKIRLHLSKNLFENIAKEVLAESKKMNMSGGAYTEAVKMPKQEEMKEEKPPMPPIPGNKSSAPASGMKDSHKMGAREALFQVIAHTPAFRKEGILDDNDISKLEDIVNKAMSGLMKETNKMKKMEEVDAVKDTEGMRKMHEMSSKEKMAKGLYKEDEMEEMQINVAEDDAMNEYVGVETSTGLITALATLLGVGIPLATSLYKDLKGAKTPEEKKQVMQSLGKSVAGSAGAHLQKPEEEAPKESFSLNELRKKTTK
jgi:hypothetical protein